MLCMLLIVRHDFNICVNRQLLEEAGVQDVSRPSYICSVTPYSYQPFFLGVALIDQRLPV